LFWEGNTTKRPGELETWETKNKILASSNHWCETGSTVQEDRGSNLYNDDHYTTVL
jgi:hypothetical protein